MDLKKIIKNFIWKPDTEYQFSIPDSNEKKDNYISSEDLNLPKNIFTDISTNIEFVKTKYNSMINSDIILREFVINVRNAQY